jgi:Tol biopolymer transport system component
MRVHAVKAALVGLAIVVAAFGPIAAQDPPPAESPRASAKPKDSKQAVTEAVDLLTEQLRRHPPAPSKVANRIAGLYMIDVSTGEVTLVADEPDPGTNFCGSPAWSYDGKRVLFDAMGREGVGRAHVKAIELIGGKLTVTDLGVGNCPTSSPAGDRIAFWLNPGGVPGAEAGIWLMKTDGSQRRLLGSFGRPKWSPGSSQFMLIDFAIPAQVTLMDVKPDKSGPLQVPGLKFYSVPSWAGDGTIVAVVGAEFGDTIALIDVTSPPEGRITEVLWKMNFKGKGPGVSPLYPAYTASSGRCVFIGKGNDGMALYSFQRGHADPPKRLEPEGYDSLIQDVAFSPDGRYALFSSSRTGPRQRGSAAGAGAPRREEGADKKNDTSRSAPPPGAQRN